MPTKPDALIELVQHEIDSFHDVIGEHPGLFPHGLNLYPVPFFGNILNAEVLTLALNPSWKEFEARSWPDDLGSRGLTDRLLNYFDLWESGPYSFFERCQPALSLLGRSYQFKAAHIDLLPHPTKRLRELGEQEKLVFAKLIGQSSEHLEEVLRFCRGLKLVLVLDFTFPIPGGITATTFDFLANHFPPVADLIGGNGDLPPIFRGGGIGDLYQRVLQRRQELRNGLQQERILKF